MGITAPNNQSTTAEDQSCAGQDSLMGITTPINQSTTAEGQGCAGQDSLMGITTVFTVQIGQVSYPEKFCCFFVVVFSQFFFCFVFNTFFLLSFFSFLNYYQYYTLIQHMSADS